MNEMNTQTLNKKETGKQTQMSPNPKKKTWKKIVLTIIMLLLMVGISVIVANIVHKTGSGDSVTASANVENGLSAYELAVQYGYDGSMQDWLASLSGKSAYEIAVENGYSGTEEDWISALEAAASKDNASIKTAAFSEKGELLIILTVMLQISVKLSELTAETVLTEKTVLTVLTAKTALTEKTVSMARTA